MDKWIDKHFNPVNPATAWIATWVFIIMIAISASACRPSTPEERAAYQKRAEAEAQAKVQRAYDIVHACDKNDGISRIESCTGRGCHTTYVICKDGMMRKFDGGF